MKITRKIERTIELSSDEVYHALARHLDLPSISAAGSTHFKESETTIRHQITLVCMDTVENDS